MNDLGFSNGFLDMTPKVRGTEEKKKDKLDFIKIKTSREGPRWQSRIVR